MDLLRVNGRVDWKRLAINVLVPVAGGTVVGMLANKGTKEKYAKLEKPDFSPPGWVFPAVWTALYTTMGIARYRAASKTTNLETGLNGTTLPYDIQLGLNFLWSFLFFKWGLRGTAFVEVATMLAMITWATYEFYKVDKTAGTLMVPYIGWVAFAMGLNYSIWRKNM